MINTFTFSHKEQLPPFVFLSVWKDAVMGFIKILPKIYVQLPRGLLFSQNPEGLILNFQGSTGQSATAVPKD